MQCLDRNSINYYFSTICLRYIGIFGPQFGRGRQGYFKISHRRSQYFAGTPAPVPAGPRTWAQAPRTCQCAFLTLSASFAKKQRLSRSARQPSYVQNRKLLRPIGPSANVLSPIARFFAKVIRRDSAASPWIHMGSKARDSAWLLLQNSLRIWAQSSIVCWTGIRRAEPARGRGRDVDSTCTRPPQRASSQRRGASAAGRLRHLSDGTLSVSARPGVKRCPSYKSPTFQ